jgi:hypothetical protein
MRIVATFTSKTWLDAKAVREAVKEAKVKPLAKAALLVEREAKASMKEGGRTKQKGPRGGKIQIPSPVGTPPHVQTGTLRASIAIAKTMHETYLVGPRSIAWYGRVHEFSKRFPRRFMFPALVRERRKFPALFKNAPLANTRAGRKLNSSKGPP